ncbi:MAG: class I SAM-dependent methyltransferase [Aeoliella sp.]
MNWFPAFEKLSTLCLASGGGQQGPLLAAAGCHVTVFDNSAKQLEQDRFVAERDSLAINTVEGDMSDLSPFADESFELIVHPCSNCFVPEVLPVWSECSRILQKKGVLIAGFCNPIRFALEDSRQENGVLEVKYPLPHSDFDELSDPYISHRILEDMDAFEFGHTLTDQIGGQLQSGFLITDFYEDKHDGQGDDPISDYMDTFIATRAVKL